MKIIHYWHIPVHFRFVVDDAKMCRCYRLYFTTVQSIWRCHDCMGGGSLLTSPLSRYNRKHAMDRLSDQNFSKFFGLRIAFLDKVPTATKAHDIRPTTKHKLDFRKAVARSEAQCSRIVLETCL